MSKTRKDKPEKYREYREQRRERHPRPYRRPTGSRDITGEDNWDTDTDSDDSRDLRSSVVVSSSPPVYIEPACYICGEHVFPCDCCMEDNYF
jgi:hypothetical protein